MKKLAYVLAAGAAVASASPAYAACGWIWRWAGYCVPGAF